MTIDAAVKERAELNVEALGIRDVDADLLYQFGLTYCPGEVKHYHIKKISEELEKLVNAGIDAVLKAKREGVIGDEFEELKSRTTELMRTKVYFDRYGRLALKMAAVVMEPFEGDEEDAQMQY
jgi:hypothetical protein